MTNIHTPSETEPENEVFPVEPRYHPIHKIPRIIFDFLASVKLAMLLLVTILACCVVGVTVWRGIEAGRLIFGTIWFNALLVLLVINVAFCFFGRVWHRKLTLISFGMILFHLSFVFMLGGIVYNSLFCFRGNIRLTEGEILPSGDPQSYDLIEKGKFFSFSQLKGETSLIKMHAGYKVAGDDKRAAYEVAVGEGKTKKKGIIYVTHKLAHQGVEYFNDREGYSLLLTLADKKGQELYGGHFPLQSIQLKDSSIMYSTGYKEGDIIKPDVVPFPAPPEQPRFALQVTYEPSKIKDSGGVAQFQLFPLDEKGVPVLDKPQGEGKAAIGDSFTVGEYALSAREVRYWVAMLVRYEPGKPIVLTSLWVGLFGMLLTTVGRMRISHRRGKAAAGKA